MRQVAISVAIVMPEIGFDDEPMMPTMRPTTVTKKKPKTTIRTPEQQLAAEAVPGEKRQQRDDQHEAERSRRARR